MNTMYQNTKPGNTQEKVPTVDQKIKETWRKMSDDDIKLYKSNKDQFFAKLEEKQNISREEADKKLKEIERSCATDQQAGKSDNLKSA